MIKKAYHVANLLSEVMHRKPQPSAMKKLDTIMESRKPRK